MPLGFRNEHWKPRVCFRHLLSSAKQNEAVTRISNEVALGTLRRTLAAPHVACLQEKGVGNDDCHILQYVEVIAIYFVAFEFVFHDEFAPSLSL